MGKFRGGMRSEVGGRKSDTELGKPKADIGGLKAEV